MLILSTLVTGWLTAAAITAAPLPSYDVFYVSGVIVPDAAAAPQSTERERVREQAQREQEQAQREREKALDQAQREREKATDARQQAQEQASRDREQAREQAERGREQAREQAERDRERAHDQAEKNREKAQEKAEKARERAQDRAERAREGSNRQGWVEVNGDRQSRSFQMGADGGLLLNNVSGDVIVTAGTGSEIRVEAFRKAKGPSNADARQQLENVQVTMQEAGGRVEVRSYHRGRESRAWVDFNVVVPAGARVELQSVSGDITITGVKGEVRAETVSGDVKATGLARVATLKSLSGDVTLTDGQSDMALTLSSVSGDILATNLKARSIDVNSVSGDTIIRQCACDRAQVHSVNGDIEFGGRLAKTGRYEMKTHSGDITFTPAGIGFELTASTFSGDIRANPALTVPAKGADQGWGPGRTVRTTVAGGGAFVELSTFSGDISLAKAQ
jgi:DUF4097 and DUF4098 domain-containing protein YvlB